MNTRTLKTLGYILLVFAFIMLGLVVYQNSPAQNVPVIFSNKTMIEALWTNYKKSFIAPTANRTVDPSQNNITTSEGQSYTMLRAVWTDDQTTFDKIWVWTQQNMQHSTDHLFAWKYGQISGNTYGVLTSVGGQNSASDADTDIALALAMASKRWNNPGYLTAAQAIAKDIWANEVVTINGKPYLASDNVSKNDPNRILVNVSYISPYSYRVFAQIDPQDNWQGLINNSYDLIGKVLPMPLDKTTSANIPPDWIQVNKATGAIQAVSDNTTLTTNYSYDAMRLPFRLALDWQWNRDPRDVTLLQQMSFFTTSWNTDQALYTSYGHDGSIILKNEVPAIYGGTIGYYMVTNPTLAKTVYENKLQSLYSPDTDAWKNTLGYYDDNWAWFGISLYDNYLVNLYPIK